MKHSSIYTNEKLQAGDAAVKGLFNGFVAGIIMAVVLVAAGLMGGVSTASTLERFTPVAGGALAGVLAHLAVSGIYGMIFGLLWSSLLRWLRLDTGPWQAILAGAAYGLLLWLGAQFILLPTTDAAFGSLPVGQFLSAHLAYGLILGWLFGRS
jgi:hypothetical protein